MYHMDPSVKIQKPGSDVLRQYQHSFKLDPNILGFWTCFTLKFYKLWTFFSMIADLPPPTLFLDYPVVTNHS